MKRILGAIGAVLVCAVMLLIASLPYAAGYLVADGVKTFVGSLWDHPELLIVAVVVIAILWTQVAFANALDRLLRLCAEQNRVMKPGRVWFILIPYIGQIAGIFVVNAVSKSTRLEFASQNRAGEPHAADFAGYVFFATSLLSFIPALTSIGLLLVGFYIVSLIIYWRSVAECRRALASEKAGVVALASL